MIRFISTQETLTLRSSELRDGQDINLCYFEGDEEPTTFHVGYFEDTKLISVATFHKNSREGLNGIGFQLRGMATHPDYQKRGIGNQLLNFAIVFLRGQNANYLWCNARKAAYRFYLGIGFEFISQEFEIPKIGMHRVMYLKII